MLKKLIDWKRPIFQTCILVTVIILSFVLDFVQVLASIVSNAGLSNSELPPYIRVASTYGRWPLSVTVFIVTLLCIRKINEKAIINPNNNIYHDHAYFSYLFCSLVLGYKICRLRSVPIPMQIKLVTSGTFDAFITEEGIHEASEKDKVKIAYTNAEPYTSTINMVISDTYRIALNQLPETVKQYTTIEIDRSSNDMTRYKSEKLVKAVTNAIRGLPQHVTEINVFATTNPSNTYRIAKEAFSTAGRDRIKHLYAFQQGRNDERDFETSRLKIY